MRVLSGIQPSGQLHLGNYFGSIRPNLEEIARADSAVYFIADLHALTSLQNAEQLRQCRLDAALDLLACGFDPARAMLFYQSAVPEHTQLLWLLSTVSPMGLLERAVSYKEKVEKGIAASVGLFAYPVLQAADILLYHADRVPVGKDQKQHIEIARDIAGKFNAAYGETFTVPEAIIPPAAAVVPGTDGQKMSKSYGNTIPLFAEEAALRRAILGITTDSRGAREPKDPDTCIVYQIHKLFLSGAEAEALAAEYRAGLPYSDAKKRLLAATLETFAPMRSAREKLVRDPKAVEMILAEGARRARSIAAETLARAFQAVGLR